ncbi:MAG: ethanolamine ammonia-lyase subunit EutB [Deltaproteobacteria bacterium]|jgi:ethanolamine ammonia-lyase large subunit|nr:ethanolamine ammonia-lyase subunit EutB [Deltaproteobacteria bacterium]
MSFIKLPLKQLLAKASPPRSGDVLAGVAAQSDEERVRAQQALAEVPLERFLNEEFVPYETDEITRLILDTHDREAFQKIKSFTVGELRDYLLAEQVDGAMIAGFSQGITPEMAAAVSKLMRAQDLALVASKITVITKFRDTLGLKGRFSSRVQPNHPTDDAKGILASTLDGLSYGCGDAVIGVNPVSGSLDKLSKINYILAELLDRYQIPTQSCVLTHVTNTIELIKRGAPVDLCFQSVAGTEKANQGFGINLQLLAEAYDATLSLKRYTLGKNVMYFETGQGAALSSDAAFGIDQQTVEARAYAVCRHFSPLLVNSVVGFIGPEYLYNGKEIIRAGLEDHFCGKLLGLPMGMDICYTNHTDADQDDMDLLLTMLGAAGCTYVMGVPGADDIMLNYQSTSYHDINYLRKILNKSPAPEFQEWLEKMGITDRTGALLPPGPGVPAIEMNIREY